MLTLFSAPNYCYRCGNQAAIMQLDGEVARQRVEPPHPPTQPFPNAHHLHRCTLLALESLACACASGRDRDSLARAAEHLNRNIVQFDPAPRHQHGVEAKPKTKALPDYFL